MCDQTQSDICQINLLFALPHTAQNSSQDKDQKYSSQYPSQIISLEKL